MSFAENRAIRWSAGGVLLCVVLVVATWFVFISPRRAEAATLALQDAEAQRANQTLSTRIRELEAQYRTLPEKRAKLDEIHRQIPDSADLPALVRAVDGIASASGVTLEGVTPGKPQPVNSSGTSGMGGQGGTKASGTASDMVAIPVDIVVTGNYFQSVAFLRQLQTELERAILITELEIARPESGAGADADDVGMTVTGHVFIRTSSAKSTGTSGGTSTTTSGGSSTRTSAGTQVTNSSARLGGGEAAGAWSERSRAW